MHLNLNKICFKFSKQTCVIIIFPYEKYLILFALLNYHYLTYLHT